MAERFKVCKRLVVRYQIFCKVEFLFHISKHLKNLLFAICAFKPIKCIVGLPDKQKPKKTGVALEISTIACRSSLYFCGKRFFSNPGQKKTLIKLKNTYFYQCLYRTILISIVTSFYAV